MQMSIDSIEKLRKYAKAKARAEIEIRKAEETGDEEELTKLIFIPLNVLARELSDQLIKELSEWAKDNYENHESP